MTWIINFLYTEKQDFHIMDYQQINYPILWGGRLARPLRRTDILSAPQ